MILTGCRCGGGQPLSGIHVTAAREWLFQRAVLRQPLVLKPGPAVDSRHWWNGNTLARYTAGGGSTVFLLKSENPPTQRAATPEWSHPIIESRQYSDLHLLYTSPRK